MISFLNLAVKQSWRMVGIYICIFIFICNMFLLPEMRCPVLEHSIRLLINAGETFINDSLQLDNCEV